jgi:6-phosphogluconolactonase (cycloisomerase 2 family)
MTGKALDVRTESSVEVFDLDPKSGKLVHIKSISSEALDSPNSLAVDKDGKGFLVINGGRTKLGPFRGGPFQFGSSSISYCRTDTGICRTVASQGFDLANSIAIGHDGFAYISMSSTGTLAVYKMAGNELTQIDALSLGSALDHLSVDARGNILITAFTDPVELQEASTNPQASVTAGTVLMVQKKNGRSKKSDEEQYVLQPMIEDEAAKLMSTTTTAVHDVHSDRIFLAGVFSPGISICEKRS